MEEYTPPAPLLAIDWANTPMLTDADVAAVWAKIAPTGDDWEMKLDEVPDAQARVLGMWMLKQGNFTCAKPVPPADCAPLVLDVERPKPGANVNDPCLRRMLAMWSINALEDDDVPMVMDSLRSIATIPPPESELVASAIEVIPERDQDARLELIDRAYRAGQRDVANGQLGELDEAHVITAATKFHIDGALEILSAQGHRAVFVAAIADEKMQPKGRTDAMDELLSTESTLGADTKAALVAAAKSKDCVVAAHAARALLQHGDKRFVPTRPRTSSQAAMMRALCVLAAYERLQANDEPSLLAQYVPPKGLERVTITYDALGEVDTDGDKRFVPTRPRTSSQAAMMRALCVLAAYERLQANDEPSLLAQYVPPKGLERVTITYDALGEVDTDGDGDPHTAREVTLVPKSEIVVPEVDDMIRAFKKCERTACVSHDRDYRFGFKSIGGQLYLATLEIAERPPCPSN